MPKSIDKKREKTAKETITKAKDAFKHFIPRDTIQDIEITECEKKDGAYELSGPVGTKSPTGKLKTFHYTATVIVDEEGNGSISSLSVKEL